MKVKDIFEDAEFICENSFDRRSALDSIRNTEEVINQHLVKILSLNVPAELTTYWKREILNKYFRRFAAIKLKPNDKHIPAGTLYNLLYDAPFNHSEVLRVDFLRGLIDHDQTKQRLDVYLRNGKTSEEIAAELKTFYTEISKKIELGESGEELINSL